ncbi:MAG TPA: helix-turn-helix transcriptional regulator [Flavisolibacter sp.]|nr:helix-turn-helix transcriptional regulator [Flavisolibacter sp.]
MPGHVIKKYREMRNYSQKYVSSKMGISQNAYSKIENNITQLTVHHVKELSKILEVPITDLLNDEFEIHKPVPTPNIVTRTALLAEAEKLHKKIQTRHASRHEAYLVALSLIKAAENALSSVH